MRAFAAKNVIRHGRIACKTNAVEIVPGAFVDVDRQVDDLPLFIKIKLRLRQEIDIGACTVKVPQILKTLAQLRLLIDLAGDQSQHLLDLDVRQNLDVVLSSCPDDPDLPNAVALS